MSAISVQAEAFIRRSMVAMVATRSPKLRPFVTPLWFVLDGDALYVTTGTQSWAGRNIEEHPTITLLFGGERGTAAEPFLRLRGRAACENGFLPWRVLARVAAKYYVAPRALFVELRHLAQWGLCMRYYGGVPGGAGYLKVVPTSAEFVHRP
jgi:predicted pyridoxine 5'-phosphate oxidase superfamily flavin-nucleotide-binding protein